jgi:hypothetical protein
MAIESNNKLILETREECHIPPYFTDDNLLILINEGIYNIGKKNPTSIDVDLDLTFRTLVKNYVFYSYNHQLDEFWINYNSSILAWQWGTLEYE